MRAAPSSRRRRRGLSLIELTVATGLTGLLATLLVTAWSAFGRPAVDVMSRSRLAREASLAAASLAEDFGGCLSTPEGRLGVKAKGLLVGRMAPDSAELRLCYDGGETPDGSPAWDVPDTVVSYYVDSGNLIRWDQAANVSNVVARDVLALSASVLEDRTSIVITFQHRTIRRAVTFEALQP